MKLDYNPMDYAPGNESGDKEYALMPEGEYQIEIVDSQEKVSAAGNSYLSLKLSVTDGAFKNRLIWDNLNVNHPKNDVRDIARKILGDICTACGVRGVNDTAELHYKPMQAIVAIDLGTNGFNDKNVVKKYLAPANVNKTEFVVKTSTAENLKKLDERPQRGENQPLSTQATQDDIPF